MYWIWSIPLTLGAFQLARVLNKRYQLILLNPLLIAIVLIVTLLLLTKTPYQHYFQGSKIINDLLQPAVVALAFPLYESLQRIRERWKSLLLICLLGSIIGMVTGTATAFLLGAPPEVAASILPKSVTTPLAMAVAVTLHGIPSISAICVIFAGILGAVCAHSLLNKLGLHNSVVRGLAIGCASHALGTARCAEVNYQEGAFSSLALVLCGIFTSLLAPVIYPLCVILFQSS
ncbi:MAG: CidB/LrgB family autolysis modulator [Enterobacteriaceae bacterium]